MYLAVNTSIDQQVAIKVLRPEFAKSARLRERFKKEAQLLSGLDHPNIVKFLNYVETPEGVFLIMEYVKGITLEDYIKHKNGLIVESRAYPMLSEILDAFEYAHSKGIVHQDIKPSNIIIQEDGHVKIMDFGIAQIVTDANNGGAVMGTPEYMSPEQIYGKKADGRSDIYSLGVLIHNMLTGKAPYDSTKLTEQEIKSKVVKEDLPKMAEFYPYVSDKIQKVVDKATRKNPEERYPDCGTMKGAVKKAIAPDAVPKWLKYGSVALLAVVLAGAWLTWDWFRLKVDYYDDYVEVYGVPKGIGKVSKGDAGHRSGTYRFETQKGKVRRVSYVNSQGNLIPHTDSETKDRIVDMTLTYQEGSPKVDTQTYRDQHGKVIYVKDYDSNLKTCTFRLNDELGTEMTLNSNVKLFESAYNDNPMAGKSKISKYIVDFDENGYLAKVRYAGFGNVLVPDGQGIFGRSYAYDDKGRVIEETYLGKDGNPKPTKFGLGRKQFTYDDKGHLGKTVYLTVDGMPSSDGNNCPVVELTYDKWGNRLSEKYFDIEGNPMLRKDNQLAGCVYDYNDKGQCVRRSFLGIDGSPAYYNGAAGWVDEYDGNGYLSRRRFIDIEGKLAVFHEDGDAYSIIEHDNDPTGHALESRLFDPDGKYIDSPYFFRRRCEFDSVGTLLAETFLDEEGNPRLSPKAGIAGKRYEYNPHGRLSRYVAIDADCKPVNMPEYHYCGQKLEYDIRGNVSKISNFDKDDKPVMSNEGIAEIVYEYDENGNEKSRSFFDDKGNPCVLTGECSKVEWTYDDQGNQTSGHYYDTNGKPMSVYGRASIEYEYDRRGNRIMERPLGTNGKLASGQYEVRYKYDGLDNVTETSYYNDSGKPTLYKEGYHRVLNTYNSRGQCTETEYRGVNGNLVNAEGQNIAVVKREYDNRGNQISRTFFNSSGKRGTDKDKVHKFFHQYDKITNNPSHQITFGADGKPIVAGNMAPEAKCEYDRRGNATSLQCYDGYGNKINGNRGWYERRMEYGRAGEQLSESHFDVNGKPVEDSDLGYHMCKSEYNEMRLPVKWSFYGTNGKLNPIPAGYAVKTAKYNSQGQRTELAYFGVNGKPVNTIWGVHKEVYKYRNGTEYECIIYDTSGSKVGTAHKVNGNWVFDSPRHQKFVLQKNWKELMEEVAEKCPMDIGNGVTIASCKVTDTEIAVCIHLQSIDLTGINTDELTSEFEETIREESGAPRYVRITVELTSGVDTRQPVY